MYTNKKAASAYLIYCLISFLGLTASASSQEKFPHIKVSRDIELIQISQHSYVHVTYDQVPGYGRVGSNGYLFADNGIALLFNTPMNDSLTKQLVTWITDSMKLHIAGFVANHWHSDGIGGLKYLATIGIPSYAYDKTIALAKTNNLPIPRNKFIDSLMLHIGDLVTVSTYFGPSHTSDIIVTWIPSEKILYAGCMVKEMRSETLGNIADADLAEWPKTIARVIAAYPSAVIVIPGHGAIGGWELLQHTLDMVTNRK
jgi:metallo-beta-lactamase class B